MFLIKQLKKNAISLFHTGEESMKDILGKTENDKSVSNNMTSSKLIIIIIIVISS